MRKLVQWLTKNEIGITFHADERVQLVLGMTLMICGFVAFLVVLATQWALPYEYAMTYLLG